jgi:hypothetical protein
MRAQVPENGIPAFHRTIKHSKQPTPTVDDRLEVHKNLEQVTYRQALPHLQVRLTLRVVAAAACAWGPTQTDSTCCDHHKAKGEHDTKVSGSITELTKGTYVNISMRVW